MAAGNLLRPHQLLTRADNLSNSGDNDPKPNRQSDQRIKERAACKCHEQTRQNRREGYEDIAQIAAIPGLR
jgi:hypothetical protein